MPNAHNEVRSQTVSNLMFGLIIAQLIFWTCVPTFTTQSLPLDVVREGLSWGQEWQWGYHKHPPLVSWLANLSYIALGKLGPFLLSQICIGLTYWFTFLTAKRYLTPIKAALSVILLTGVFYYSWPTPEFNHNVAQMPVWAAAIWLFHRVLEHNNWRDWIGLGLIFGAGVLVKYSVLVLAFVMVVLLLSPPNHRNKLFSVKPVLGFLCGLALVFPHLVWLFEHDFVTLKYLSMRSGEPLSALERFTEPLDFGLAQLADHLPMIILMAIGGLFGRSSRQAFKEKTEMVSKERTLLGLAFGPFAFTCLIAMVTGAGLRDMWGAPMWSLSGVVAIWFFGRAATRSQIKRTIIGCAVLFTIVVSIAGISYRFGPEISGKPGRVNWPDGEMASRFETLWNNETQCDLTIVAGENWLAGLVTTNLSERPSVWIDGDYELSPWISPERVKEQGALVMWRENKSSQDRAVAQMFTDRSDFEFKGEERFVWPVAGDTIEPLIIKWGIIRPSTASRSCEY